MSAVNPQNSGYISTTEGIRVLNDIRERGRPFKEYLALEEQPWYWGNISKCVSFH